ITEARDNRNDNFLEGIRRFGYPALNFLQAPHPHLQLRNRFNDEVWPNPPPPRPPSPPLMYPGLGGVPRPVLRNYRNNEDFGEMPFPNHPPAANTEVVIKCPECRQITKVPPEGLPVNYRLQELVAHVAEAPEVSSVTKNDVDKSRLPKCLVCDEVMAKGVYLTCRACIAENEAAGFYICINKLSAATMFNVLP
ncbi:unnamed protein product, partial [Strongylus vulgaris]